MLRKLFAVLVLTALVLTTLPAQAAPAASDRDDALLRLTDWFAEIVQHLGVLVGAEEAGPHMDPNGGTNAGPHMDPNGGSTSSTEPVDTTTEAGPHMDPNG